MTIIDEPTFGRHLCDIDDFIALLDVDGELPHFADRTVERVPVFVADRLRDEIVDERSQRAVRDVMADVLDRGPGIFVIEGAIDHDVVDRASEREGTEPRGAANEVKSSES